MRAFTVAAWAFHLGADRIVLLQELNEALELKTLTPGSLAFQDGEPKPGFDLANSPVKIESLDLRGKTIFQRTTSGTRGALAAAKFDPLVCASFATAKATATYLRSVPPAGVAFIITGENGRAVEDIACAEYIAALTEDSSVAAAPFLEAARASRAAMELREAVAKGYSGVHDDDVERCLEPDRFDFVMRARFEDGLLTLRRNAV